MNEQASIRLDLAEVERDARGYRGVHLPSKELANETTPDFNHRHVQRVGGSVTGQIERAFPFYLEHDAAAGLLFLVTDTG